MVVLIALGSLGCGPTEEAYLAKVNEAETYERLSQQRQTEIMEKEKELETTMGHLGEAEAQAGKLYQELAKTEAQLEITMDRLRKAETQTGRLYEELAKTEAQLETTIGRLEKAETQTGRPAEEFAQKEARLRETNVQLEKVSIINQKHEENIKDFFLQIVNLEQKEQELQEKYKTLKEHEKDSRIEMIGMVQLACPTRTSIPSMIARVNGIRRINVVPLLSLEIISTRPPNFSMFDLTTSIPIPRPDKSVTEFEVENPGAKISCHTSSSVRISLASAKLRSIALFKIFWRFKP